MAKKRMGSRRQRATQKVKPAARAKARKRPAPKTAARKSASKKVAKRAAIRRQAKSVSRAAAVKAPPPPVHAAQAQPFWDPKGTTTDFRGDAKAHTKPEDQRAHIRMTAPRTWSSRQPGRG